jgi:signal transduction histidine kinase
VELLARLRLAADRERRQAVMRAGAAMRMRPATTPGWRALFALAAAVGVVMALVPPLAYFYLKREHDRAELAYAAEFTAQRISRRAYVEVRYWRFRHHRLVQDIQATEVTDKRIKRVVRDFENEIVARTGEIPPGLSIRHVADIVVDGKSVGTVEFETSIQEHVAPTLLVAFASLTIGLAAFGAIYAFPLRALRNSIDDLARSNAKLDRARAEAVAANEAKSVFLANMSHELRTPLNSVIGFSDILRTQLLGPVGNKRYVEYAEDIHFSSQHLIAIIDDILDLSRIEAGKVELNLAPLSVAEVVADAGRLVRERAAKAELALCVDISGVAGVAIRADETKIKQVLVNLLANAIKFTPPGGSVEIKASGGPDGVRIDVRDNGIGIRQEDIPVITQRFGQVEGPYQRKHGGAGLGLTISKYLVELHRGTMLIASTPGKGTTVSIILPEHVSAIAQAAE